MSLTERPTSLRSLVEDSGLFDPTYYAKTYGEEFAGWSDPLEHFLAAGQHRDYKPNAAFDPLVYLVRFPEAKGPGPVEHYLRNRGGSSPDMSARSVFPDIPVPKMGPLAEDIYQRDCLENMSVSSDFRRAQATGFEVDGHRFQLLAPAADDVFGRLRDDRPFAFSRLPHGFWDGLLMLRDVREQVVKQAPTGLFSDEQLENLSIRLCDELLPDMGIYGENVLAEIFRYARAPIPAGYLRSVAFKPYPTADERLFWNTTELGRDEIYRLRQYVEHFRSDAPVYDATTWKRWAFSGDLKALPVAARERPLVLVGASRVGDLGARWRLPWFIHLEIPLDSYRDRYEILQRCRQAVIEARAMADSHGTKRPIILLQGGSFAYWLIERLFAWDPSVFYLDLGQTLHTWFLDIKTLRARWTRMHPRMMMQNCDLDAYYRSLGMTLEPPYGEG